MSNNIDSYQTAEQEVALRLRPFVELVRADGIAPSKELGLVSESSYRRGFQQGVAACVYALEDGAKTADLERYMAKLANWRYALGKYAKRKLWREPPPHWTGKGTF